MSWPMSVQRNHPLVAGVHNGNRCRQATTNWEDLLLVPGRVFKDPFKAIKHVGQTLSYIVRWSWTVFDQCWIVLGAGVLKRIQNHRTMLDFNTRHVFLITRAEMLDEKFEQYLNKVRIRTHQHGIAFQPQSKSYKGEFRKML